MRYPITLVSIGYITLVLQICHDLTLCKIMMVYKLYVRYVFSRIRRFNDTTSEAMARSKGPRRFL